MVDHIDDFPVDWFCFLLSFCFALFVLFCFVLFLKEVVFIVKLSAVHPKVTSLSKILQKLEFVQFCIYCM